MSSTNERFTLRAAVYLILFKDEKVLLSRRLNTGWMDGSYSLISGHIDGDESVFEAMIREALEEAGIKIYKKNLKPLKVVHSKSADGKEYISFFFIAEDWEGEPSIKELDKCDDMSWFPIKSLPENTIPDIKDVIENYQDGVSFAESGWE
jgi:8-oxo-dGTP pyrophosphatase MutT (NUDIX family)